MAAGADLVIEAVFEDPAVKAQVFAEIEPHLAPDALLGSNTSTLPITELAEGVTRPGRLHRPALLQPGGQDAAAGDHQGREDQRGDAVPGPRPRQADQEDADRRQRQPRLLHQPRDRHVHQRGHRDAARGGAGADDRAGLEPGRLPGAGAAALRRAEPQPHAQDPRRDQGRDRGRRGVFEDRPPSRSSTACSSSSTAAAGSPGRLLRLRGRQAGRPVEGPQRAVPARSRTPRRCRCATSRSGCCSSSRSRPSSASTRA